MFVIMQRSWIWFASRAAQRIKSQGSSAHHNISYTKILGLFQRRASLWRHRVQSFLPRIKKKSLISISSDALCLQSSFNWKSTKVSVYRTFCQNDYRSCHGTISKTNCVIFLLWPPWHFQFFRGGISGISFYFHKSGSVFSDK